MSSAIRKIAEAVAKKTVQNQAPKVWNGTVVNYDRDTNTAMVTLDGDGSPIAAIVAGSFRPVTGTRVQILLAPPSSAYVTGILTTHVDPKAPWPRSAIISAGQVRTGINNVSWPDNMGNASFGVIYNLSPPGVGVSYITHQVPLAAGIYRPVYQGLAGTNYGEGSVQIVDPEGSVGTVLSFDSYNTSSLSQVVIGSDFTVTENMEVDVRIQKNGTKHPSSTDYYVGYQSIVISSVEEF